MRLTVRWRSLEVMLMTLAIAFAGCQQKREHAHRQLAATSNRATSSDAGLAHDPAHPPIDCPLHKLGVDPAHVRPFDDVEKYIAFLEKPDRAVWQKPDDVVAALGLTGSETVVVLGSGSGYFTIAPCRRT
jgi:hypothetical protein